jgi:RimJ/RimL family protein N-acetyltransferase
MLEEGNVNLRALLTSDQELLAKLANNKKIWDNLRDYIPFPYTLQDAEYFISITKEETTPMTFAIEYEKQFCGVIGLVGQSDVYRKTAEIGYWIGEPFWNKGIATQAVKMITYYGLNQLDFVRIHTGVFEHNIASIRVLEKCGYHKDCIFEKSIFKNGVRVSIVR